MGLIKWFKGLELWAKILLGVLAVGIVVTVIVILYKNQIKIGQNNIQFVGNYSADCRNK
jgi:alpha-N-acetylglucosamine transferase